MGLVQNLRKTLLNSVSRILAELLSAFIRRRAKLILRKPDSYSETTSSPSRLTTGLHSSTIAIFSAGTTEKIIMGEPTTEDLVKQVHSWAIDRISDLTEGGASSTRKVYDALAICDEFKEWFEDDDDGEDIEVMCIEEY